MTIGPRLRVAVMGAGMVGCYLGGRLAREADVTLIGRPQVLDPIRSRDLTVEAAGGPSLHIEPAELTLSESARAVEGADVVLVCTKSGSTIDATRQFAPSVRDDAVVIGFQNGLHGADLVREGLGEHLVLAGMVPFNIARTGPSTYRRTSAGQIVLGAHPDVLAFVAALRRAEIDVHLTSDMQVVLHGKVLINLNNGIQALSRVPLRAELLDRDYRRCVALCQAEALRVFTAAGVVPKVPIPFPAALIPSLLRLPTAVFRVLAAPTLRLDPEGTSSMSDDLGRGRRTEIDDLQGEIVRMGAQLGVATPVCARVVDLVHVAEKGGETRRRWTGTDLLAELRSARRSTYSS